MFEKEPFSDPSIQSSLFRYIEVNEAAHCTERATQGQTQVERPKVLYTVLKIIKKSPLGSVQAFLHRVKETLFGKVQK